MYCGKCGCKIRNGEVKCSNCGADVTEIEYCGGFWGLVGEDEKKVVVPEIQGNRVVEQVVAPEIHRVEAEKIVVPEIHRSETEKTVVPVKQDIVKKERKRHKRRMKVFLILIMVLFLACLAQMFRVSVMTKKYRVLRKDYEILYQKYQDLDAEYQALYLENEELKNGMNVINGADPNAGGDVNMNEEGVNENGESNENDKLNNNIIENEVQN